MPRLLWGALILFLPALQAQENYPSHGKWNYPGLWLKVTDEVAQPGAIAQIQVTLTEPKPIIRTKMLLAIDEAVVDEVLDLGIYSENGEAMGTAVRNGNVILVEASSPTGELGNSTEYPVMSLLIRLRKDLPEGARAAIQILPDSVFLDPAGAKWTITDNAPGSVTIGATHSIEDVQPAWGLVKAGQPIRILGSGFKPWSKVSIYEAPNATTRFVTPEELQVTLDSDLVMDQRRIEVVAPDRTEKVFYPGIRGVSAGGSAYDLLGAVKVMFSHAAAESASLLLPPELSGDDRFAALALQNPTQQPIVVRVEMGDAATTVTLLPNERFVRGLDEIFPYDSAAPGMTLKLTSTAPVQAMGLIGELTSALVHPIASSPQ